jgi:DNA-binding NarL/FixJ family response regulator
MDLQMPVMGGLDATIAIRQRERVTGQHVRIVAMTAHALNTDRERCLAAGMDGYLSKPIDPPALFFVVEEGGDGSNAQTTPPGPATFDEETLRHRLADDDELMVELIRLFLQELPSRLTAIGEAVASRNAVALRASAHSLKGSTSNLAIDALCQTAHALERIGDEGRMEDADAAWRRLSEEAGKAIDTLRPYAASDKEPFTCAS